MTPVWPSPQEDKEQKQGVSPAIHTRKETTWQSWTEEEDQTKPGPSKTREEDEWEVWPEETAKEKRDIRMEVDEWADPPPQITSPRPQPSKPGRMPGIAKIKKTASKEEYVAMPKKFTNLALLREMAMKMDNFHKPFAMYDAIRNSDFIKTVGGNFNPISNCC